MTSIAFDGKTLATDSRCCSGNIIISDNKQKLILVKGTNKENKCTKIYGERVLAFALCGDATVASGFIYNFINGTMDKFIKPINDEDSGFTGVFITNKSIYTNCHGDLNFCSYPLQLFGEGSGLPFIMSALELGLDAIEAVKHAIKFDAGSGGEVQSVRLFK